MSASIPKYKASLILTLWQQGIDTDEISTRLSLTEGYVYNILARWRA